MKKDTSLAASPEREDRYVPKQYSTVDQLMFGVKALGILAVAVLALWLLDTSL